MPFYADLHIHSKYSRATSRDCDLENLSLWAQRKGIAVVATGDFTHPAWYEEICNKLVPAEPGLWRLQPELERAVADKVAAACRRPTRFLLEVEISTIYKKGDRTRKVHHLIYAGSLETAGKFRSSLDKIGNINSDGRPILGLDSRHLLEITLESGPDAYLIPAHVWTPWFAVLGSKSGFDSVEECYGDLSEHIFAVETGLSSDPPMNWRVSSLDRFTLVSNSDAHSPPMLGREACVFDTDLDYCAMREALETGHGYGGTVEFYPEEGKYHMDGHRKCGVRYRPTQTCAAGGLCPECGKPLTVGVMHRVEELADRSEGVETSERTPFRSLVPLPEIVSELRGVGPKSKTVQREVRGLVERLGPELGILERLPRAEIERGGDSLLAEAIDRLRRGEVHREAGYDGEYGVIRLFTKDELAVQARGASLFGDLAPVATIEAENVEPAIPLHKVPAVSDAEHRPQPTDEPTVLGPEDSPKAGRILAALDTDQRRAAEVVDGPLLIVAGPGTGKTRTLTHRIAHLISAGVPPQHCLAVTFTRRAAEEMRERLERLIPTGAKAVQVVTFHALGLGIVREYHAKLGLPEEFRVADSAEAIEALIDALDLSRRDAARFVETVRRNRLQAAPTDADGVSTKQYIQALRARSLVDFYDLLTLPLQLFEQHPEVRKSYRRRFQWISVDEYQDIDALQYRLIRLLVPPDGNLCVIGDPDQSIYRFRGADVSFFLRFQEDYPTAPVIQLNRNYRSVPAIVKAAGQAVEPGTLVKNRRLESARYDSGERVVVHEARSEAAEAEFVVATIERILGGISYFSVDTGRAGHEETDPLSFNDFAVLYRTKAQADALIVALERSGIPFQARAHDPLRKNPAVRKLVAAVCATGESTIPISDRLAAAAETLAERAAQGGGSLASAVDLLSPLAARCGTDIGRFASEVELGSEIDTWDPRAERVSLLTIHAAKGLEFPVVFVVGCEEDLLPHASATDPESLAEERRLFFVAISRAESRLYLSYAAARRRYGKRAETAASHFLGDIADELLRHTKQARSQVSKAKPEDSKQLGLFSSKIGKSKK